MDFWSYLNLVEGGGGGGGGGIFTFWIQIYQTKLCVESFLHQNNETPNYLTTDILTLFGPGKKTSISIGFRLNFRKSH